MKQQQISSEQTLVIGNQFGYNNSENISYLYNGFGDRTGVVANVTNISNVATIEYPDANTITKTTSSLTKAFLSDARGNLIQINEQREPTLIFEYDADNNMIGAEVNGTNWTFRYDSQNQMYYSKITFDSGVIDERFYIYDGLDCIAETDVAGTILREYIRIGNTGGIVAEVRHNDTTCASGYQSGTYYYHYNHRGDTIAVTKQDGTIVFKADYDAYGNPITDNWQPITDFKPRYTFSTKRYFKSLGLYYYGYRWYLPELGRWTTKDPISHLSGELNLYNFCVNNPLCFGDSYGLASIVETARKYSKSGSTKWNYNKRHSWRYPKNTYKCNVFTGDMIKESGLPDPRVDGMIGKRYPSASAWADPDVDIPGWSKPHNNPQPGDVGSDTRHMGINTGDGTTISAASTDPPMVKETDWGFRELEKGGRPVVWRSPCN